MKKNIPDTIGVSLDTREGLRLASESVTILDIPGYKLTREIGRGSFGTVWQAVREKTGQNVAVKIVENSEDLNWEYFRRELDFLSEIEEHPYTLTILDAQLDNEPPYIVMPLAEGGSLEEAHRRDSPDHTAVEPWLTQMAEALAFIHRKGVIHCDLKPSNVLLSSGGAVRIADLGQARRTGHGVAMGTIGFMAPEQCADETKASPSVSWDVYGYGATAYWLLTGKIPRIKNGDGVTLGTYLESFESSPLVPIRKYNPSVDKELASIVEGCLKKNAKDRIPSLDAVLEDFERRENKRPLLCRKPWTTRYRVATALKRRTVQVLLLILFSLLLASGYAWQQRNENRFLNYSLSGIHAHESGRFEEAYLHWLRALDYRPGDSNMLHRLAFMPLAQIFPESDRVNDFALFDSERQMVTASEDGSVTLWDALSGERKAVLKHSSIVPHLAISPDEKWLGTAAWDGKARIFDLGSQELRATLEHGGDVTALAFSQDGKYLATAELNGQLHLWETATGASLPLEGQEKESYADQVLAPHPKRSILAALVDGNSAALWNLQTGDRLPHRFQHKDVINEMAFTPDGSKLITVSDDNTASVWNVENGALAFHLSHDSRVNTLFVLSNTEFATGCEDGSVTIWGTNLGDQQHQFFHRRPIRSLSSNEDRTLLIVGTGESDALLSDTEANGTVNIWDLGQGYRVGGPWPHDGPVAQVRFYDEDRLVLSASGSARQTTAVHPGAVRAWRYFQPALQSQMMTFTDRLVPDDKDSSMVQLENGIVVSHGEKVPINQYAFDPDRLLLATASKDKTVRVWNAQTGESVRAPILLSGAAKAVAFDPTGELLASASEEPGDSSGVRIWEIKSGYPVTPLLSCPGKIVALEFSPDSSKLVGETERGQFSWDLSADIKNKSWRKTLQKRLRAKLDRRDEVVSIPEVSETVMTKKL